MRGWVWCSNCFISDWTLFIFKKSFFSGRLIALRSKMCFLSLFSYYSIKVSHEILFVAKSFQDAFPPAKIGPHFNVCRLTENLSRGFIVAILRANPRKTEEKRTWRPGIHPLTPGARSVMKNPVRKQKTDSLTPLRRFSQKGRKSAVGGEFQFLLFACP